MYRVGLAGLGRQGKRYLQHIDPVAILDSRDLTTRGIFGIVRTTSTHQDRLSAFVAASDAIIIATPSPTHCELVCAALESGKPCLVEKPMVTTREEMEKVREVWRRTGTPLLCNFTHLWHPEFVALKAKLSSIPPPNGGWTKFGGPEPWDYLEWAPHSKAFELALGCPLTIYPGPFEKRIRELRWGSGSFIAYNETFDGDAPCSPTPLARVVNDFVHLRQDYRWGIFGFDVMELVLDGMLQRSSV